MTDAASSRSRSSSAARRFKERRSFPEPTDANLAKRREALRVADELYRQKPDWLVFFREMFGVEGAIAKLFPTPEERAAFDASQEHAEIHRKMAELRAQSVLRLDIEDREPTRVITVRLPKSIHEALRAEAHARQTSMNKLCIAKLIHIFDEPAEGEKEPEQ
jgi:hypothetical protein